MTRILMVFVVLVGSLLLAPPAAHAGNWAETVLDPMPDRVTAGTTYTVGYWVLQHGSYPYRGPGELGPTALVFTDGQGGTQTFGGTRFGAAGHYVAEVVLPHDGLWLISATQGRFEPDDVGSVTVPGPVESLPIQSLDRTAYAWGTARPVFPPNAGNVVEYVPPTPRPAAAHQAAVADAPSLSPWVVLGAGAATLLLAAFLVRHHVRRNRAER
jgi:hypothetical protein